MTLAAFPPRIGARVRHWSAQDRLLFLARCLGYAPVTAELREQLAVSGLPWPDLLGFAKRELLAPTLWVRLGERGLVGVLPPEVAAALRRSHAVNAARNARIRAELLQGVEALNAAGVEPVVLKGAVDLVVPRYADPGARILRDIDLFVPSSALRSAVAALEAIGFVEAPLEATKFVTYYADLTRKGNLVGIDLQFYISGQRDLLTPEEALAGSVAHEVDGVRLRTLSPDHQIIHNLLHSEVQDRGSDAGLVWLRQLLDLVALRQVYNEAVDWEAIQTHFASRRFPRLLAKRLYMAQGLLEVPLPDTVAPSMAARFHYERCLLQMRWRWLERASALQATLASAFDPRLIDVIYGSGHRGWRTGLQRVFHGARLWDRHRGSLRSIIAKRLTKFD